MSDQNNGIEIKPPWNVMEVVFQRRYPGYIYRREVVGQSDYGGKGTLEMVSCYASDTGEWIGDAKTARFLCKKRGLRNLQKTDPSHCVASIGFNSKEGKWYGWSHRAICGFGIGDCIFEERYGNDKTPFAKHGRKKIRTLDQAKKAAANFAGYVS